VPPAREGHRRTFSEADTPSGMNRPIGVKPDGSKADRMVAQSAKIEAGHVHLPRKQIGWIICFSRYLDFRREGTMIRLIASHNS